MTTASVVVPDNTGKGSTACRVTSTVTNRLFNVRFRSSLETSDLRRDFQYREEVVIEVMSEEFKWVEIAIGREVSGKRGYQ